MNPRKLTPDRTVQEEIRIMVRLGFTYQRTNGAGHHVFEHPRYGEKRMSSTPGRPTSWRRRHREYLAELMGLTSWQLERLIAGQSLTRRTAKRKRSTKVDRRRKQPVSLLTAAVPAARAIPPVPVRVPNPGSAEAVTAGCRCPVFENRKGLGLEGRDGIYAYVLGCPVHSDHREEAA